MKHVLGAFAGLLGAFWFCAATAFAAPKVEIMVVGNAAPESGLDRAAVDRKLEALMTQLYKFDGVNPIIDVRHKTRFELEQRLSESRAKFSGAEFVIVYFLGLGAHDADGVSYLVPHDWTGAKDGLIELNTVLDLLRSTAKDKSLVILDAIKPRVEWQHAGLQAGLGRVDREAGKGGVMIAYNHGTVLSGKDGTLLTEAFEKRVTKPVSVKTLASLMQEDVSLESSGLDVPRVSGVTLASLELNPVDEASAAKSKHERCVAENQSAPNTRYASMGGPADGPADVALVVMAFKPANDAQDLKSGGPASAVSATRKSSPGAWYFCPFFRFLEPEPQAPEPQAPKASVGPPKPYARVVAPQGGAPRYRATTGGAPAAPRYTAPAQNNGGVRRDVQAAAPPG